jgi:hypothetical protein
MKASQLETTTMDILEIAQLERRTVIEPPKMTIFEATMIAEGQAEMVGYDPDDQELMIEAWQRLIDTGTCWSLQGWFGRTAANLIETGVCTR